MLRYFVYSKVNSKEPEAGFRDLAYARQFIGMFGDQRHMFYVKGPNGEIVNGAKLLMLPLSTAAQALAA